MSKYLVTGAGGDIGRAIVRRLAGKDNLVVAQYRTRSVENIDNVVPVYGDFSTRQGVEDFYGAVKVFGRFDGLVNCAGESLCKLFSDCTDEETEHLIFSDFTAPVLLTKRLVPAFVAAKEGSIVNVSSIWGIYGGAMETVYSAAKGGLIAFTKALAKELGPSSVRVNCVSPGLIDTRMNDRLSKEEKLDFLSGVPLSREGKAEEVAEAVAFLLSDKAAYITGVNLEVSGGV